MNARLHPHRVLDEERAACKAWPGVLGRSIVVLPLVRQSADADTAEYDLEILVVQQADNGNTERSSITHRIYEEKALVAEGGRIEDVRIDTARLSLSPEARAFGVRVRYASVSRTRPGVRETLSLYVPQAPQKLAKVLDRLETSSDRGEWDTNCIGTFEQVRSTVSTDDTRTAGWADLRVRTSHTASKSNYVDGSCVEQHRTPTFSTAVLRFDGKRYGLPEPAGPLRLGGAP